MNAKLAQILISLSFIGMTAQSHAGLKWVDIGINGLTCSMCTRSVEMSLRRLEFVDSVAMSLEKTEGRVYLKAGQTVSIKEIARAVVNAGFSVRFLSMEFNFKDIPIDKEGSFVYQRQPYTWINKENEIVSGDVSLKIVDEGFLPRKESAIWKKKIGLNDPSSQKVFHVVREE